jgi:hypothetical protein
MAGIKIVDLPSLGRDLISTDLFELSLVGGSGSRKITGQEIMNASKLNVGGTPIINGTVGRILFQGASDTLGESANLFWDNTNGRLGIGTSSPAYGVSHIGTIGVASFFSQRDFGANALSQLTQRASFIGYTFNDGSNGIATGANASGAYIQGFTGTLANPSAKQLILQNLGGNVGIGTTTDAGFKLDVNGTARLSNSEFSANGVRIQTTSFGVGGISMNGSPITSNQLAVSPGFTLNQTSSFNLTSGGAINFVSSVLQSTSGNASIVNTGGQFGFASGTASGNALSLVPFINTSGTYSGIIRGLYYAPTFGTTVGITHRAIDLTSGDFVWGSGYSQYYGNSTEGFIQFTTSGGATQLWLRPPNNQNTWNASYWGRLEHTGSSGTKLLSASYKDVYVRNNSSAAVYTYLGGREDNNSVSIAVPATTGNVLIGTTTDAGYKLDVNGTARFTGNIFLPTDILIGSGHSTSVWNRIMLYDLTNGSINITMHNTAWYIRHNANMSMNGAMQVGSNTSAVASAVLQATSTTQGFLPPRMTNAQRTAIASPAVGLIVYCTDATEGLWIYKSSGWTFIV